MDGEMDNQGIVNNWGTVVNQSSLTGHMRTHSATEHPYRKLICHASRPQFCKTKLEIMNEF